MNDYFFYAAISLLTIVAILIVVYPFGQQFKLFQWVIAFMVVAGSATGYWQWGAWRDVQAYWAAQKKQTQVTDFLKQMNNPDELIEKFKSRLVAQPNSAKGWYLLGRLYVAQEKWSLALAAFTRAHVLKPDNERWTINYAHSLWKVNGEAFNPQIRAIFQSVLQHNPAQPDALSMLAIDAFHDKDYLKAIAYWRRLLILVPTDSAESSAIRKAIAKAHELSILK